jgi:ribulose-phosphate 3-epimerase
MGAIVPAILPTSKPDLEEKLARFGEVEGITSVQIDIVDGRYATPASWPYTEKVGDLGSAENLPHLGKINFEVDLMVTHPEEVIGSWITLGATRITVHLESTQFLPRILEDMRKRFGFDKDFAPDLLSIGIAIGLSTDLVALEPHLQHADYVQFMGIKTIGKQGQPFDANVIKKIAAFKKKHPEMQIQVDGGVTLATAPQLLKAGVDRLIVGHAFKDSTNLQETFNAFTALTEEYGIYE